MTHEQARALMSRLASKLEIDVRVGAEFVDAESLDANGEVAGDSACYWQFNQAQIRVAMKRPDGDVVRTILHEMIHVLQAEVERATERLLGGIVSEAGMEAIGDAREREVRKLTEYCLPLAMREWREVKREVV